MFCANIEQLIFTLKKYILRMVWKHKILQKISVEAFVCLQSIKNSANYFPNSY